MSSLTRSRHYGNALNALRVKTIVSLLLITVIGFAAKLHKGWGDWWLNNYVAGLFYEVFWCLAVFLIFPKTKPLRITLWVFLMTCFLEVLQLWHPPFLEAIRSTFIGRTLIGTTFGAWDFLYYAIGCGIGWLWLNQFSEGEKVHRSEI